MRSLPLRLRVLAGAATTLVAACVTTEAIPYPDDRAPSSDGGGDIGGLDAIGRPDAQEDDTVERDTSGDDAGEPDADTADDDATGSDGDDSGTDDAGVNPNTAPVAVAAPASSAWVEVPFTLDGSASYDPDDGDRIVEYRWNLDDGRTFIGPTRSVVFDTVGDVGGALTVTDGNGAAHSTSFVVSVTEKPPGPTAVIGPDDSVATVGGPSPSTGQGRPAPTERS